MAEVTRTTNPLPFEVLEPHKFEDVVRGLLYDFRDWQTIEPTGKGGSDDGYDARGWEKVKVVENESEAEDEEDEQKGEYPMEGNRWMIQCKREKEITPKKMEKILEDVDPNDPPYGYILAAACDFSKKTQDKFREILLKKGVTEFYLWGKSYLEDMLYLPKNDHILFTAFGISFNTRRRSKKTEIRFALNNKNKVFRIWGGADYHHLDHKPALIRDFNDEHYPDKSKYSDFKKNYRWIECTPSAYYPLGVWFHAREYFGYIDTEKKEYGVCLGVDLLHRQSDRLFGEDRKKEKLKDEASEFWQRLPTKHQAKISVEGLIFFNDMLIIDDKGDSWYNFPHIFVEFNKNHKRPFSHYREIVKTNKGEVRLDGEYKRIDFFPKKFRKQKAGQVHKEKLDIPYKSLDFYGGNKVSTNGYIFDLENKYGFLNKGDIASITDDENLGTSYPKEDRYIEVTQIYETTVKKFFEGNAEYPHRANMSMQNPNKEIKDTDKMTVIEVRPLPRWAFENKTK